jgi:hypothetical protein
MPDAGEYSQTWVSCYLYKSSVTKVKKQKYTFSLFLFNTQNSKQNKKKSDKMVSIKIGEYLNQRLKEVGVDVIFGCPGDYNMVSYIYLKGNAYR